MSRGRRLGLLYLLGALSFLLVVLTGCSRSGKDGSGMAQGTSRLTLQLANADQTLSRLLGAASPAQTRQTNAALIQVAITAADIASPIEAQCALPEPTLAQSDQFGCRVTETETEFTVVIELRVPPGNNRLITVLVSDTSGTDILLGRRTENLIPGDQQVSIELKFLATPTDLENQRFAFADGAAFGLSGQEVTLEFGDFGGTNTGPVRLRVPATNGVAAGSATISTLEVSFEQSENITAIPPGTTFAFDATLEDDGSLVLTNQATGLSSTSTPPVPSAPRTIISIVLPPDPIAPGTQFTVPVTLAPGEHTVISYLFDLTFNGAVVQVTSIGGGDFPFETVVQNTAFAPGMARFAANVSTFGTAVNAALTLARVTFQVVGNSGDESALTLSVPSDVGVLVTDSFERIPPEEISLVSGSVTVQ